MAERRAIRKPLLHYFGDAPVSQQRTRIMSKIRGKDTKPEIVLRRALWHAGLRFRVHDKSLPGTPDISNKSRKVAIFVDGCFWHGCPEHFRAPKTRTEFWTEKIIRNQATRRRIKGEYGANWLLQEVFECEIRIDPAKVAEKIRAAWP